VRVVAAVAQDEQQHAVVLGAGLDLEEAPGRAQGLLEMPQGEAAMQQRGQGAGVHGITRQHVVGQRDGLFVVFELLQDRAQLVAQSRIGGRQRQCLLQCPYRLFAMLQLAMAQGDMVQRADMLGRLRQHPLKAQQGFVPAAALVQQAAQLEALPGVLGRGLHDFCHDEIDLGGTALHIEHGGQCQLDIGIVRREFGRAPCAGFGLVRMTHAQQGIGQVLVQVGRFLEAQGGAVARDRFFIAAQVEQRIGQYRMDTAQLGIEFQRALQRTGAFLDLHLLEQGQTEQGMGVRIARIAADGLAALRDRGVCIGRDHIVHM